MNRSKTIEAMARAICDADPLAPEADAPIYIGVKAAKAWQARVPMAEAALTAYESHLHASGRAVVPVESADKIAALMDHEFHAGTRAGWDAAHADNPIEAFAALDKTQKERLSILTASPSGKAFQPMGSEKDDE